MQENNLRTLDQLDDVDVEDNADSGPNDYVKSLIVQSETRTQTSSFLSFIKRTRHNGVMLSTADSHAGNSWIEFYEERKRKPDCVSVGCIKKIVSTDYGLHLVVYKPQLLSPSTIDPFADFIDFPGKLYSANLSSDPIVVEIGRFKNHVARYQIPKSSNAVIVSLSRY